MAQMRCWRQARRPLSGIEALVCLSVKLKLCFVVKPTGVAGGLGIKKKIKGEMRDDSKDFAWSDAVIC